MKNLSLLSLLMFVLFSFQLNAQVTLQQWTTDEVNPGLDFSLQPEIDMVWEGEFSLKVTLLQAEVPYLFSALYDVNAGDSYNFSIRYMDNDPTVSIKVYAEFYDADGEDIFGEEPVFGEDGSDWQVIEWTGVVPDGAVSGYVWVKFYDDDGFDGTGTVYLDDALFVVDEQNLVPNFGFEAWDGLGVGEIQSVGSMQIYPNPASDFIQISGLDFDRVQIQNLLGQTVYSFDANSIENINIESLEEGIYLVSVLNNNQIVETKKLLKK